MANLYQKGKDRQWDANKRIDWTREINPENPLGVPDAFIPIYGSKVWDRLTEKEKGVVRHHMAAWQFSQFLHGEQGALICTAKIVQTVPDIDAKYYAGTQVMDEARHVETYSRYIREKLQLAYPINPPLGTLLDQIVRDSRWDFTYLGMQILIEGLALAAFATIRDNATEPTAREVNAYVMQDEARHVAFGRLALRDYYPQLTESERREREEFTVEACYLMRDRFLAEEVWRNLDYDGEECVRYVRDSKLLVGFRGGALHAHRADAQGHRPLGQEGPGRLHRHGGDGLRVDRSRRGERRRRGGGGPARARVARRPRVTSRSASTKESPRRSDGAPSPSERRRPRHAAGGMGV